MKPLPREDLEHILLRARPSLELLRGRRLLVTGGTGFVGRWLVQTLIAANDQLDTQISLILWTRNVRRALDENPSLENRADLHWLPQDIRAPLTKTLFFDGIIHAATDVATKPSDEETRAVIVEGTRNVLKAATDFGVRDVLYVSSGGVYGPGVLPQWRETSVVGFPPTTNLSAYGESKRQAESLCAEWAQEKDHRRALIARFFALLGPGLPLNADFAIGNFINDVISEREIRVQGDGSPVRSYLYVSDLIVWLLKIFTHGQSGRPYHVGSEAGLSLKELAHKVTEAGHTLWGYEGRVDIQKAHHLSGTSRHYVPSTQKIRAELDLEETVSLDEALRKTLRWHRGGEV